VILGASNHPPATLHNVSCADYWALDVAAASGAVTAFLASFFAAALFAAAFTGAFFTAAFLTAISSVPFGSSAGKSRPENTCPNSLARSPVLESCRAASLSEFSPWLLQRTRPVC
jgi:hypothetical protein